MRIGAPASPDGPWPTRPPLALAALAGLAAAGALWAMLVLAGSRHDEVLEATCREVQAGDGLADVVAVLGLEGYRPGCRHPDAAADDRPVCVLADLPEGPFPYWCDGEDCSLYWRAGAIGCLVELAPPALSVTSAEIVRLEEG